MGRVFYPVLPCLLLSTAQLLHSPPYLKSPSDHPYDITLTMYYRHVSGHGTPTLGEVSPKNFPEKTQPKNSTKISGIILNKKQSVPLML